MNVNVLCFHSGCSKVQTLPSFTRALRDRRCCDGDAVTFECGLTATPDPDIRWEKDGKVSYTTSCACVCEKSNPVCVTFYNTQSMALFRKCMCVLAQLQSVEIRKIQHRRNVRLNKMRVRLTDENNPLDVEV
jgi:Immunoglobulin I-set domain